MKRPILISLMITAVISLLLMPADMSSGDDIEIDYNPNPDIIVDVSYGTETKHGVTITVKVYSDVYDLQSAGLLFYTYDEDGKQNKKPDENIKAYSEYEGKRVATYTIADLKESVFMSFTNMHEISKDTRKDENTITVVLLISMILAIVMAVMMISIIRGIDSYKASEALQ